MNPIPVAAQQPTAPLQSAAPATPSKAAKIKKIALQILKALGIALLGAAFGGLILASGGTAWAIGGIALGGAVALASFLGAKFFIKLKRKKAFPAFSHQTQPPVPATEFPHEKFKKALDKEISPLPAFQEWKSAHSTLSDKKIERYFWKRVQHNQSAGQAHALIETATAMPNKGGGKLLKNLSAKRVFFHQMIEIMSKDLGRDLEEELNGARNRVVDTGFKKGRLYRKLKDHVGMGTICLQGKKKNQTLFFEIKDTGGRFYDPTSRHAGFHDRFASKEEFLRLLDRHVSLALFGKKIFRAQFLSANVILYS